MRGKEDKNERLRIRKRITPAYAGKSGLRSKVERNYGDHPRLCGEKLPAISLDTYTSGSPPPMRGKGCVFAVRVKRQRITPAYAGKRKRRGGLYHEYQDHPRLCGEKCPECH